MSKKNSNAAVYSTAAKMAVTKVYSLRGRRHRPSSQWQPQHYLAVSVEGQARMPEAKVYLVLSARTDAGEVVTQS